MIYSVTDVCEYTCVCVHMFVHDSFSYGSVCVCVVSFGFQECQHVCSVIGLLCVSVLHTDAAGVPACS